MNKRTTFKTQLLQAMKLELKLLFTPGMVLDNGIEVRGVFQCVLVFVTSFVISFVVPFVVSFVASFVRS